ncbi:MAG: response regulator transcription factor [Kiritimatiellaeota bacterium]|nr:response regulator transcription factor [Kiritimatiellota bacterium]
MNPHILLAEDDLHIREGLMLTLESEGYRVTAAHNGAEALREFARAKFDLVLLDVMMPEVSGFDVCRAIRRQNRAVPVILLTAKSEEVDKVVGLELGADDYITKPFGVRELLARVAAVLRRAATAAEPPKKEKTAAPPPDLFAFGAAQIERKKMRATRGRHTEDLTARELALMDLFRAHPDEVLSRDQLLNAAWGINYLGTTRTLDQHIAQLRKKIEKTPDDPAAILTVHGIGYRYQPPT